MFFMLISLIVVLIVIGGAFAYGAAMRPGIAAHFERLGGALLIAGLALLGYALRRVG